jgi:hypothetical protein
MLGRINVNTEMNRLKLYGIILAISGFFLYIIHNDIHI